MLETRKIFAALVFLFSVVIAPVMAADGLKGLCAEGIDPMLSFCMGQRRGHSAREKTFKQLSAESGGDAEFFTRLAQAPASQRLSELTSYHLRIEKILGWDSDVVAPLLEHLRTAISKQSASESTKQALAGLLSPSPLKPLSTYLAELSDEEAPVALEGLAQICGEDGHGESAFSYQAGFENGVPAKRGVVLCPGMLYRAKLNAEGGVSELRIGALALPVFHELGHLLGGHSQSRFHSKALSHAQATVARTQILYVPKHVNSVLNEVIADEWAVQGMLAMLEFDALWKEKSDLAKQDTVTNVSYYCQGSPLDGTHPSPSDRIGKILAPPLCRFFRNEPEPKTLKGFEF